MASKKYHTEEERLEAIKASKRKYQQAGVGALSHQAPLHGQLAVSRMAAGFRLRNQLPAGGVRRRADSRTRDSEAAPGWMEAAHRHGGRADAS